MRSEMRAIRVDSIYCAIFAAPYDKLGAEIAQRSDISGGDFIGHGDGEPAKGDRQAGKASIGC
jgi:hypothetical protein